MPAPRNLTLKSVQNGPWNGAAKILLFENITVPEGTVPLYNILNEG